MYLKMYRYTVPVPVHHTMSMNYLHVSNLILFPLVLLPLSLHQLQPSLHEGVVVTTVKLQLPAKQS
jgi:hypothetical protein